MKAMLLMAALLTAQISRAALADSDTLKTVMIDGEHGWTMRLAGKSVKILRTDDGGKHWEDITPDALTAASKEADDEDELRELTDISALGADEVWITIGIHPSAYGKPGIVRIEQTTDAGKSWREKTPVKTSAYFATYICMVSGREGFFLALGSPAAGEMVKELYRTQDAGMHWHQVNTPHLDSGLSYYPTGISFRSATNGWITGTYHGMPDAPVFYTRDGGKTWALEKLKIPEEYQGGYADTYSPVFIGKNKLNGYLPVKLVRHAPPVEREAWINYESEDGGLTWNFQAPGTHSFKTP